MVPEGVQNVTVYDPAAGSGTLVLALAHELAKVIVRFIHRIFLKSLMNF